jgi:predicted amidohydrolase YtcJ
MRQTSRGTWRRSLLGVLAAAVLAGCASAGGDAPGSAAELVLTNGRVVTMDPNLPEAQAVAISGDRIVAVGTAAEIQRYVGSGTEVIDLAGRLAIPGFIEGHGHFMGLGRAKTILDLTTARNWDEIVAMVGEAARSAQPGSWIVGRGWHQSKWDRSPEPMVEENPVHTSLSRVSPDNPVYLTHASGHGSFVNAKAMEVAGITRATPDPAGGEIVKDAQGNPTGLLRETAQGLAGQALARYEAQRPQEQILADQRRMVELAGQ